MDVSVRNRSSKWNNRIVDDVAGRRTSLPLSQSRSRRSRADNQHSVVVDDEGPGLDRLITRVKLRSRSPRAGTVRRSMCTSSTIPMRACWSTPASMKGTWWSPTWIRASPRSTSRTSTQRQSKSSSRSTSTSTTAAATTSSTGKPIQMSSVRPTTRAARTYHTILRTGRRARRAVRAVDGAGLLPRVRLVPAPGHMRGTQMVVVGIGERAEVVIAGDVAVCFGEPMAAGYRGGRGARARLRWSGPRMRTSQP